MHLSVFCFEITWGQNSAGNRCKLETEKHMRVTTWMRASSGKELESCLVDLVLVSLWKEGRALASLWKGD